MLAQNNHTRVNVLADSVSDLILIVGQCDLYSMVQ